MSDGHCPDCGAYSPDHEERPFQCDECGRFFPELRFRRQA
jgi:hypothetical protein